MAEKNEIYLEEKPSKWTFKNYFKSIAHFKWWVIGSTLVCTVLGYVSFAFVLNPIKQKLTASFTYANLAATSDDYGTYRFIDGTVFNISDIVSYDNLKAVQASKEEYSSVNVDKLYKSNTLSVSVDVTPATTEQAAETKPYVKYSIVGVVKHFPNAEIAKSFTFDLINSPKTISNSATEKYSIPTLISESFDSDTFIDQISQLSEQYNAIKDVYSGLEKTFGSSAYVEGKQLSEHINEFRAKTSKGQISHIDNLSGELYSRNYIKYEAGQEQNKIDEIDVLCGYYVKILKEKKDDADRIQASIENLAKPAITSTTYNEYLKQIVEYTEQIDALQHEMDGLKRKLAYYGWGLDATEKYYEEKDEGVRHYLKAVKTDPTTDESKNWIAGNTAFAEKVKTLKPVLLNECAPATNVYRALYKNSKAILLNSGYVAIEGGMSPFIGLAAGLVGGFLLSSLICCGVFISKEEKE